MKKRRIRPMYAAGIVERHDRRVLIALPKGSNESRGGRLWCFPYGPVKPDESPEAAMRRIARNELGIHVEIVVGQPPLVFGHGASAAEFRYFFCAVAAMVDDEWKRTDRPPPRPGPYAELRWVTRGHLRGYEFEPFARPVADWLLTPDADQQSQP